MRQPYRDLYALFRHEPEAEAYFNSLPSYVQEQLSASYQAVDSMERLRDYAQRMSRSYPAEVIGGPGESARLRERLAPGAPLFRTHAGAAGHPSAQVSPLF